MASELQEYVEACEGCGSSTHPTSSYAVKEKSRKRLCTECIEKSTNAVLDPEPNRWMCDQHEDQPITYFCMTCQTNACGKCVCTTHRCHEFEAIEKVKDEMSRAKRETISGSSSAKACDFDKLAVGCEEDIDVHFKKMRKEAEQKCREANDTVRERHRQRKERIDAEVSERIKRLYHIRDKRFVEENAEEEEEAALIEKERLKTTAEINKANLAHKSRSRSIVEGFKEDSQVDNDIKHLTECDVRHVKHHIVRAVLSVETFQKPFPVPPHIVSHYKGPADHSQQRTITLLPKIIGYTFVAIFACCFFAALDISYLDIIFGCLYADYIPRGPITDYNYSTTVCIAFVLCYFFIMQRLFQICCDISVVPFELILELSKRFEPELGVVGKVSSVLVATCRKMVNCKRSSDIEQRFNLGVCGVSVLVMPNRRTKQLLLRFVIGTIISFVHTRCYYPRVDWICPLDLLWHPIILCLVTLINRPWMTLVAYASFYTLSKSWQSPEIISVFVRNSTEPLVLKNGFRYNILD